MEKKFNLDGPDCFAYYWHDIRQDERYFSKRRYGGGSVMVWDAMSYYGLSSLCVIQERMNSEDYCNILTRSLLPFPLEECPAYWIFQQDNSAIRVSRYTRDQVSDDSLDVLL